MSRSSNTELVEKARCVLEYAVECAAKSFGEMIDFETTLTDFELDMDFKSTTDQELSKDENVIMLKTEILGSIPGIHYFLFSQHDMKTLTDKAFLEEILPENKQELKYLLVEFMKEIENVAAASAISQISQQLDTEIYGDVPKIQAAPSFQVQGLIGQEVRQLDPVVRQQGRIIVPELGIAPVYDWFFNGSFVERLVVANDINTEKKLYA